MNKYNPFLWILTIALVTGCAGLEEYPYTTFEDYAEEEVVVEPVLIPSKPEGVYHKVQKGQTIWRIAKTYGVSVDELIFANRIPDVAKIEVGQLILIPGAKETQEVTAALDLDKDESFRWPIKGKVVSYFNSKKGGFVNRGIDINASTGANVMAARSGYVVFADEIPGYAYTVILEHGDGLYSVYGRNQSLNVSLNDAVKKGQIIAELAKINNKSFLHFEIRNGTQAKNPLHYLP